MCPKNIKQYIKKYHYTTADKQSDGQCLVQVLTIYYLLDIAILRISSIAKLGCVCNALSAGHLKERLPIGQKRKSKKSYNLEVCASSLESIKVIAASSPKSFR